jgi:hypothetical protein
MSVKQMTLVSCRADDIFILCRIFSVTRDFVNLVNMKPLTSVGMQQRDGSEKDLELTTSLLYVVNCTLTPGNFDAAPSSKS